MLYGLMSEFFFIIIKGQNYVLDFLVTLYFEVHILR